MALILIFICLNALNACFASDLKKCITKQLEAAQVIQGTSWDSLFERLSDLELRLDRLKAKLKDSQETDRLKENINQSLEMLSSVSETDAQLKIKFDRDIGLMEIKVHELEGSNPSEVRSMRQAPIQSNEGRELSQLSGMEEIVPGVFYGIPNGFGKTVHISFTEQVLKEMNSKKIDPRFRQSFFQAILNGVIPPSAGRGVKIMKTADKIPFVEVKSTGAGVSGTLRIYGCIKGNQILLIRS